MYISGKITGIEAEAETLFAEAEKFLLKKNFEPLNPMKLPHNHDKSWKSYMKECIIALCKCDGIPISCINNINESGASLFFFMG